jgi:hypothetical protein
MDQHDCLNHTIKEPCNYWLPKWLLPSKKGCNYAPARLDLTTTFVNFPKFKNKLGMMSKSILKGLNAKKMTTQEVEKKCLGFI